MQAYLRQGHSLVELLLTTTNVGSQSVQTPNPGYNFPRLVTIEAIARRKANHCRPALNFSEGRRIARSRLHPLLPLNAASDSPLKRHPNLGWNVYLTKPLSSRDLRVHCGCCEAKRSHQAEAVQDPHDPDEAKRRCPKVSDRGWHPALD